MEKLNSLTVSFPDKSKIIINDIPDDSTLYEIKYSLLENEKIKKLKKDFYFSKDGIRLELKSKVEFEEIDIVPILNTKQNGLIIFFITLCALVFYCTLILKINILLSSIIALLTTQVLCIILKKSPILSSEKEGILGFCSLIIKSFDPEFRLEDILINE